MKFTKIPVTTFENIQLNAGIILDAFDPNTGEIGNLLGATSGGINFKATPSFKDFGEDIDNCPKNMMELKKLESWDIGLSGTFATVTAALAKSLVGPADVADSKIIPRNEVLLKDFKELWWVGDYSSENSEETGGFVAIKMMNTLSTGGFQIQSTDKEKGKFAFEYTAHYSMKAQDTVPCEIFVQEGSESVRPVIELEEHSKRIGTGEAAEVDVARLSPSDATVTWTSSNPNVFDVDTQVSNNKGFYGTVINAAGTTIVTGSITIDGVTYTDTCTFVVYED